MPFLDRSEVAPPREVLVDRFGRIFEQTHDTDCLFFFGEELGFGRVWRQNDTATFRRGNGVQSCDTERTKPRWP